MRVLHLVGSPTGEFLAELSRLYARDALETLADPERYEVAIAHVAPGGRWSFPADLTGPGLDAAPALEVDEAVSHLRALAPDVVVPQMFCRPGMTSYRALFEVLGVPVIGNPPDVMAVGADKPRARAVVAHGGVAVPEGVVVHPGEHPALPALPVVVKPADSDNSLGITLVRRPEEVGPALAAAFEHASAALVETYVPAGREVRCAVVERDRAGGGTELVCLPLEEYPVDAEAAPIRLPADKLARDDDGGLGLVAKGAGRAWIVDPTDPVTPAVWEAARRCHVALGCRDYGLFDFRVDPDGRPWFLEAGLYCSFARSSVVTTMAVAAGTGPEELFAEMAGRAGRRRQPERSLP
ncbi:D-alanine--D-alanine ligase [Actinomycetospora sp. TBRC 11914]|uniref:D-alanine--D-alanine ligase family protein n=1 Tax=Actinomycetospora sp. TBRC 11914 TaxID=2729387 RepID=UPI0028A2A253|nr:D-alanine--D-alanine ligase [Actinomycetospora sp. TBRC 11914]